MKTLILLLAGLVTGFFAWGWLCIYTYAPFVNLLHSRFTNPGNHELSSIEEREWTIQMFKAGSAGLVALSLSILCFYLAFRRPKTTPSA